MGVISYILRMQELTITERLNNYYSLHALHAMLLTTVRNYFNGTIPLNSLYMCETILNVLIEFFYYLLRVLS